MAENTKRRVNSTERKRNYIGYEEGSAVRNLEELPRNQKQGINKTRRSRRRSKVKAIGKGYISFLAAVCIFVSAFCVMFLRQKATITAQYESIANLESQYTKLKNDNDAKYNQVIGSISMEDVKNAAENRLGMHYADSDQIEYYDISDSSYVRQYKDVSSN